MRPNILYIIAHDLGRHLRCYGQRTVESPALDALAAEGVIFTNHFAAATPCSPSRGCIMTGRYAHTNGLVGLVNHGWDMPAEERTIVDELNDAGTHTVHFGLQHERRDHEANRYADCRGGSALADEVAARVCDFLRTEAKSLQPFYLNAGTFEVHLPFDREVYQPADPADVDVPRFLLDNPDVRTELARFHGSIKHLDAAVGEILRTLDETGLAENTAVIFTTDHGMAFPRAKSTLFDAGIGTALIIRAPGATLRGPCEALLSNIDLAPTLLDMLGREIPSRMQGRSFWPLLTDRDEAHLPRTEVFSEKNYHNRYDPTRCVRTERYKYIRSFAPALAIPLPRDIAESIAARELLPGARAPRAPEELYDLVDDPHERRNLVRSLNHTEVLADLRHRLDRWMRDTADFLVTGDAPTPPPTQPLDDE